MRLVKTLGSGHIFFWILVTCTGVLFVLCLKRNEKFTAVNSFNAFGKASVNFILPNAATANMRNRCTNILNSLCKKKVTELPSSSADNDEKKEPESSDNTGISHSPDEKTYKITETHFTGKGNKYENFYVNNKSNTNLNIGSYINRPLDIKISKNAGPQVLILHTHTSESFMDNNMQFYYESFCPRSSDNTKNVIRVGDMIENKLKENKIGVIHDKTYHDSPSYNGSYARSANTVRQNIKLNPSIGVVLDIHRDAIGNDETGKVKPVFNINGKKAAQIMIMTGCDTDNSLGFPDWQYNLALGLRLQKKAESMYPGMTRPMYFGNVKYNMNLTHGSLLIEVGSDANTIDEVSYTGELLGDVLASLLNELV